MMAWIDTYVPGWSHTYFMYLQTQRQLDATGHSNTTSKSKLSSSGEPPPISALGDWLPCFGGVADVYVRSGR
jgi:hypothetical protein